MTINNLKELQAVIKLCQKSGVTHIKLGGLELEITPYIKVAKPRQESYINMDFPEASIPVPKYSGIALTEVQAVADKIATSELTEEQLMFYSSASQEQ